MLHDALFKDCRDRLCGTSSEVGTISCCHFNKEGAPSKYDQMRTDSACAPSACRDMMDAELDTLCSIDCCSVDDFVFRSYLVESRHRGARIANSTMVKKISHTTCRLDQSNQR